MKIVDTYSLSITRVKPTTKSLKPKYPRRHHRQRPQTNRSTFYLTQITKVVTTGLVLHELPISTNQRIKKNRSMLSRLAISNESVCP